MTEKQKQTNKLTNFHFQRTDYTHIRKIIQICQTNKNQICICVIKPINRKVHLNHPPSTTIHIETWAKKSSLHLYNYLTKNLIKFTIAIYPHLQYHTYPTNHTELMNKSLYFRFLHTHLFPFPLLLLLLLNYIFFIVNENKMKKKIDV